MSISTFLDRLKDDNETLYLQSQDGNIHRSSPPYGDLEALRPYVARDVEWMRDAIGLSAEAVNLWIGTSKSITNIHHDP
jgi:peptidyl-lysine (3S)-dioxygenase / protease